jgi:hypothetical protein
MSSISRFRAGFVIVLLLYVLCYGFYVRVFPKYLLNVDLPIYSTVLLQSENPSLYKNDPVYGDGIVTSSYWASSYLYMKLFQSLHNVTQRNMSVTMIFLQLIPCLVFILTSYWFLSIFRKNQWLTLALSVALSLWLVFRYAEGIPSLYYFAVIPIFSVYYGCLFLNHLSLDAPLICGALLLLVY